MSARTKHLGIFLSNTLRGILIVREVLVFLLALLLLAGFAISFVEQLSLGDSMYFSFITGLSVGYGDISPQTGWGKVIAVLIGMLGTIFTGLVVAIVTKALFATVLYFQKEHESVTR